MMIRLRDFAEANRISDRTVQVHIKKNQGMLEGHIERKGKNGTWLDEFAVNFLLDQIQLPTKEEVYQPTQRELHLMLQLSDANSKLADAERRAGENATAAGKVLLLEEQSSALRDENLELQRKVLQMEISRENDIKSAEDKLKMELDQKHREDENKLKEHYLEEIQRLTTELKIERERKWKFPWSK